MASEPQATAEHPAAALSQRQQPVHARTTSLQNATRQLAQQVRQDLPQPAAAQPAAAPPMRLRPHGSLPERFGGDQDQSQAFVAQWGRFTAGRPVEFPTDRTKETSELSLQEEAAARNDPVLDNDPDSARKPKGPLGDPMLRIAASREIRKLRQGQGGVREYISDFKLLAGDLGWNDVALTDHFTEGLNEDLKYELVRQGAPGNLEELFQRCVVLDAWLEEVPKTSFQAPSCDLEELPEEEEGDAGSCAETAMQEKFNSRYINTSEVLEFGGGPEEETKIAPLWFSSV